MSNANESFTFCAFRTTAGKHGLKTAEWPALQPRNLTLKREAVAIFVSGARRWRRLEQWRGSIHLANARTREHIIASAAPIFNVKGFAGSSIADVLAATGLGKGGVYLHFASKDELEVTAFDYAVKVLAARRLAAQAKTTTALGRLRAYVDSVAASIENPPLPGGCPILNTAIDADDTHLEVRNHAATAMRDWQSLVMEAVTDGVGSGEFWVDVDAVAIASILTSALEGAIMVTALLREPAQMKHVASHLHTYLESLRSRPLRERVACQRRVNADPPDTSSEPLPTNLVGNDPDQIRQGEARIKRSERWNAVRRALRHQLRPQGDSLGSRSGALAAEAATPARPILRVR